MNLYIVTASTLDKWEMGEGNYLVKANDEDDAIALAKAESKGYEIEFKAEIITLADNTAMRINSAIVE